VVRITLDDVVVGGDIEVRFGGLVAPSVRGVEGATLEVVTPPGTPGPVTVLVRYQRSVMTSADAVFTYVPRGPRPTRVEPPVVPVGSEETRVRIDGEAFTATSRVLVDGVPIATVVVGPDQLQARLPAAMLATAKRFELRVVDDEQEGSGAASLILTVANPVPRLAIIEAPILAVGEPPVPIRLYGSAFRPDSTVQVAGQTIETAYRSPEELIGTIPPDLLAAPGTLAINVMTPGPGGGVSLTGQLTVTNPIFPGRFITFTSNRRGGRNHIYLLDRRGNRLDSLPEANSLNGSDAYPSISADGRFIAFQSDRHQGQHDIFLYDRERRTLDALPEANHRTAFDGFPAISADGRFIVFETDRLGKPKIFLFDLRTRALSELSHANEATAEDGLAAVSN